MNLRGAGIAIDSRGERIWLGLASVRLEAGAPGGKSSGTGIGRRRDGSGMLKTGRAVGFKAIRIAQDPSEKRGAVVTKAGDGERIHVASRDFVTSRVISDVPDLVFPLSFGSVANRGCPAVGHGSSPSWACGP